MASKVAATAEAVWVAVAEEVERAAEPWGWGAAGLGAAGRAEEKTAA